MRVKQIKAFCVGALFAPVLAMAAHTSAEEYSIDELLELSLEDLAEYKISSTTRQMIPISESPGAVSLISYEQIQRSGARTIPELLRMVPGVNVRWNPMVQTIDMRGFGSNPFTSRVLLLIDGVPYNSWNKGGFPQHPGFDFFNLNNVKHIEVTRGPGSALYGENALHGVINIVTLDGAEFNKTSATVFAGAGGARSANVLYGRELGDDSALFISAQTMEGRMPIELWNSTEQPSRGTDIFIKGRHRGLSLSYYRKEDRFGGFSEDVGESFGPGAVFESIAEIEQTINIASMDYKKEAEDGSWSSASQISYANRDGSHCSACHDPGSTEVGSHSADHGYQLHGQSQFALQLSDVQDFLVGGEYRKIDAGDHTHELADDHGGEEEIVFSYEKVALFAQYHARLLENSLSLIAGLRYDGATSPDLLDGALHPRLAAVWKVNESLTLKSGWGCATRYPSFSELYQAGGFLQARNVPNAGVIPLAQFRFNDELAMEEVESIELGAEYRFSRWLVATLDLYSNRVRAPIVVVYNSAVPGVSPSAVGFENHPNDARVTGAELAFRAEPMEALSLYANWSYQNNGQIGTGVDSAGRSIEFTYSPRHKVNFGFNWDMTTRVNVNLDISWRDDYIGPAFWYPIVLGDPEVTSLDGYALANLRATYRLPVGSGEGQALSISLYGKNLLDERPFETLVGLGGRLEGREFFIGLNYSF